jgi:hypothetical protein
VPSSDSDEGSARNAVDPAANKRIAIIQSAYIPWKGFFDLVGRCDEYVILDGAQFVKRHWHNRNQIKTANGRHWLTIAVLTKSRFEQPIDEVEIAEPWAERHWQSLEHAYRRAPHFEAYASRVRAVYESLGNERLLTSVNEKLLRALLGMLGISLKISRDRDYAPQGRKSERLVDLCLKANAKRYLSGPSARHYLDESLFVEAGVDVEWMSYGPYPPYPQAGGTFVDAVSVIDVIFNTGPDAGRYVLPVTAPASGQIDARRAV